LGATVVNFDIRSPGRETPQKGSATYSSLD
jgi:hypothetical protein